MHMFPFQSSSPWYNHNFFLNSGFVSQTCTLGSSNNSWQADLVCGWRRFAAYVHVCVGLGVEMHTQVCLYIRKSEVGGWCLLIESSSYIFTMSLRMCHDTCVTIRGQHLLLRGTQTIWLSSIEPSSNLPPYFLRRGSFTDSEVPWFARLVDQWTP